MTINKDDMIDRDEDIKRCLSCKRSDCKGTCPQVRASDQRVYAVSYYHENREKRLKAMEDRRRAKDILPREVKA